MSQPLSTSNDLSMRKDLVRLRMEMHRQEIRHEAGQVLQPLQRMRGMTQNLQDGFGIKHAPLWGVAVSSTMWRCALSASPLRSW